MGIAICEECIKKKIPEDLRYYARVYTKFVFFVKCSICNSKKSYFDDCYNLPLYLKPHKIKDIIKYLQKDKNYLLNKHKNHETFIA